MKKAFTIIESIAALAILTISLTAIVTAVRQSAAAIHLSFHRIEAIHLAESLIVSQKISIDRTYRSYAGKSGNYSYTVRISPTNVSDLANVAVAVSWQDCGIRKSIDLQTFIFFPSVNWQNTG